MLKQNRRWVALGTLGALVATTFGGLGLAPAQASSKTWRNAAIGSAAVGAWGLISHRRALAAAGAVGAGYSYYRYKKTRKAEDLRKRRAAYYYRRHHRVSAYHHVRHHG